jgi:3-phenylpropionate/cinnamic acid dioxygenase small subunit
MTIATKFSPAEILEVSCEQKREIEEFLFAEAEMLDSKKFSEWLEVLADDIRYYSPVRYKVFEEDVRAGHTAGYSGAIFDENKERMRIRVTKLIRGRDVIERPASMIRRLVTNVRVKKIDENTYHVLSNFYLTRNRADYQVDTYTGERDDIIRKKDNSYGWEIVERNILLDQTVHLGGGIGFFF